MDHETLDDIKKLGHDAKPAIINDNVAQQKTVECADTKSDAICRDVDTQVRLDVQGSQQNCLVSNVILDGQTSHLQTGKKG